MSSSAVKKGRRAGVTVSNVAVAALAGTLFGLGLAVSGMINPAIVLGFLDVFGAWNPTLAFVMGGALLVTFPTFWLSRRRKRPVLAVSFDLPKKRHLDLRLLGGAVLFGIGWGLSGLCPGPAVASLATGLPQVVVFVSAMLIGMVVYRLILDRPGK